MKVYSFDTHEWQDLIMTQLRTSPSERGKIEVNLRPSVLFSFWTDMQN